MDDRDLSGSFDLRHDRIDVADRPKQYEYDLTF